MVAVLFLGSVMDMDLVKLKEELGVLDTELGSVFSSRDGRQIIYSHPVYQYLDHRYEIGGISVHWEPDELLSDSDFMALKNLAGALMLWEAEPLAATRTRLSELGITSIVFATAANVPASGDYLDVMRANLQRLQNALP
jgi:ABC-type Zn uptake system ZnuABC Zn-binding protein ZnuA